MSSAYALLLDPSVVAKVENSRPLVMSQFEYIAVGGSQQMLTKYFASVYFVETVGVVRGAKFPAFAA